MTLCDACRLCDTFKFYGEIILNLYFECLKPSLSFYLLIKCRYVFDMTMHEQGRQGTSALETTYESEKRYINLAWY